MSSDIHALYANKSIAKLKALLAKSSNSSNSNSLANTVVLAGNAELNRRDHLGRSVLHLAVLKIEDLDWVRAMVACQGVNVNLVDIESGWTALHRALYAGNIAAATLLLGRSDIDISIKDREGLTAFDVYNSTVNGTNPCFNDCLGKAREELFLWGTPRSSLFGNSMGAVAEKPEKILFLPRNNANAVEKHVPVRIKHCVMNRLFSIVLTDESSQNIHVSGSFHGLRNSSITEFNPLSIPIPRPIIHLDSSASHTILLTSQGHVYTFGSNSSNQLGYIVEATLTPFSRSKEETLVQSTPKRVVGALKKREISGVACSRIHSVAFSDQGMWTWGTNKGQLGYSTLNNTPEIYPRMVTVTQGSIKQVVATEFATMYLSSEEVGLLIQENCLKIHLKNNEKVIKIAGSTKTFIMLTTQGSVYSFTVEIPTDGSRISPIKPTCIWSIRKKFTSVTDIAAGLDGSIVLSTISGHVFVCKPSAVSKKVVRVAGLERVVKVYASPNGSFAAIRSDVAVDPIPIEGEPINESFIKLLPYFKTQSTLPDSEDDPEIQRDAERVLQAVELTKSLEPLQGLGTDIYLYTSADLRVPVHSTILEARCPNLTHPSQTVQYSPLAVLIFIYYIYTDCVLAFWDVRVHSILSSRGFAEDSKRLKEELLTMAEMFKMNQLSENVVLHMKTLVSPSLIEDIGSLMGHRNNEDLILRLADADIKCHSTILRARSGVFNVFYNDPDWTRERMPGPIVYHLEHLRKDAMDIAIKFIYTDNGSELFDNSEHGSSDELVDFITRVLAIADELLIDKLKLLCSATLTRLISLQNISSILIDARYFAAAPLIQSCTSYITASLESILTRSILLDLPEEILVFLSEICAQKQGDKMPISRSGILVDELMEKYKNWAEGLDVGKPTGGAKRFNRVKSSQTPPLVDLAEPMLTNTNTSSLQEADVATAATSKTWNVSTEAKPSLSQIMQDQAPQPPPTQHVVVPAKSWNTPTETKSNFSQIMQNQAPSPSPSPQRVSVSLPSQKVSDAPSWRKLPTPSKPSLFEGQAASSSSRSISASAYSPIAFPTPQTRTSLRSPMLSPTAGRMGGTPWSTPTGSRTSTPSIPTYNLSSSSSSTAAMPAAVAATSSSTSVKSKPVSFTSIQTSQYLESLTPAKKVTNFAELMAKEAEEETRKNQEKAEAEAFERWFEEESRLVQAASSLSPNTNAKSNGSNDKRKKGKRRKNEQNNTNGNRQERKVAAQ